MTTLLSIHLRPPIAVARVGGSDTPLDNFVLHEDPTLRGGSRTTIEPAVSLHVEEDGAVLPMKSGVIVFRDNGEMRPVAPFFEVWATITGDTSDAVPHDVPLTHALLRDLSGSLAGVRYEVSVANRKAERRTGRRADGFEANAVIRGDDHATKALLAWSTFDADGLVSAERPIPLGSIQAILPQRGHTLGIDLDILRLRFTPARGHVYGPPAATTKSSYPSGMSFEVVRPENRTLNPRSPWNGYAGNAAGSMSPQPFDTYDGATDDNAYRSLGVVDDTCDGLVVVSLVVAGLRYEARARIVVGPPHYAPDRRPFVSLADDLADRDWTGSVDREPTSLRSAVADLFERVFETASLANLDRMRWRALRGQEASEEDGLSPTDVRSFRPQDQLAGVRVTASIADAILVDGTWTEPAAKPHALPFTDLVAHAHAALGDEEELIAFLRDSAERARRMFRPPFGAVGELNATPPSSPGASAGRLSAPDMRPRRDIRVPRDMEHDMRMPPYMRDETAGPLSLTRKQFDELIAFVDLLAVPTKTKASESLATGAAAVDAFPKFEPSRLEERMNAVLAKVRRSR